MSIELPSNPSDRTKVANAVEELVNSKIRMQAERDLTKEICARIKEELEFDPKLLKQLAGIRYKRNLEEVSKSSEVLTDTYTTLYANEL